MTAKILDFVKRETKVKAFFKRLNALSAADRQLLARALDRFKEEQCIDELFNREKKHDT